MKSRCFLLMAIAVLWTVGAKAQDHFTERDTIDVLSYIIKLDVGHLQPRHIQGSCQVQLDMLKPSNVVSLGLMNATVDSVQVGDQMLYRGEFYYDSAQLRIPVGNADSGDRLLLTVFYGSYGWVGTDGGFWCEDSLFYNLGEDRQVRPFSMGRSWFPCSDSVYDRATYLFEIVVPKGWTAVCSGILLRDSINADSSRTFVYAERDPISTYQVGLNAAPYKVHRFRLDNGRPFQVASLNLDSSAVRWMFSSFNQTYDLYNRLFGFYPWSNIRFSEGGPGSGMEHVENICISLDYYDMDYLIDHEFAHQWFGNSITCASIRDMWFNEGGATFADQLANINRTGNLWSLIYYKRAAIMKIPINEHGYYPLYGMPSQYSFMHTTYFKGAQVFHDLRNLLGDSTFFDMIRNLFIYNRFVNMDSYQLRDKMSTYSGVNLTDFYDFHIFHGGFSSYVVDSIRTTDGTTGVWLSQHLWHADDYCRQARVPVTFFSLAGDSLTCYVPSTGQYAHSDFQLPFTPDFAIVDYYYKTAAANFNDKFDISSVYRQSSYNTHTVLEPTHPEEGSTLYVGMAVGNADQEPMPGIKRWDHRRWYVNGTYSSNFKTKLGFMYGRTDPVNDQEFYLGSATKDSLRLFYRKDASEPWRMRKVFSLQNHSTMTGRYDYIQITGTPPRGEYMMAVVDTALLDIDDDAEAEFSRKTLRLSVSPNPASEYAEVAFCANGTNPSDCHIAVTSSTGKKVFDIRPVDTSLRLSTQTWPAGIYFVTLTTPSGSVTKKLIVQ